MRCKVTCLMFLFFTGLARAELIYSNNFEGIEFAASGVSAGVYQGAQANGGVLESTNGAVNAGLSVDLSVLDLLNDSGVTAIRMRVDLYIPETGGGTVNFGFSNLSSGYNLAAKGMPYAYVPTVNKKVGLYGGLSTTGGALSGPNKYDVNTTSTMEFVFYKDNTGDFLVNGSLVLDGVSLTYTNGTPTLGYAILNLRQQATATDGGSTFDNFMVETIPEPAAMGLCVFSAAVVLLFRRMR